MLLRELPDRPRCLLKQLTLEMLVYGGQILAGPGDSSKPLLDSREKTHNRCLRNDFYEQEG